MWINSTLNQYHFNNSNNSRNTDIGVVRSDGTGGGRRSNNSNSSVIREETQLFQKLNPFFPSPPQLPVVVPSTNLHTIKVQQSISQSKSLGLQLKKRQSRCDSRSQSDGLILSKISNFFQKFSRPNRQCVQQSAPVTPAPTPAIVRPYIVDIFRRIRKHFRYSICPRLRTESSFLLILLLIDVIVNTTMLVLNRTISRKLMNDIFGETDTEICADSSPASSSSSSGNSAAASAAKPDPDQTCLGEETTQSYTIYSNRFFSISSLELSTKISLAIYITIYVSQLAGFYGVVRQRESLVATFTVISSLQVIFLIFGVVASPMILVPVCILRTLLLTFSLKHCLTLSNRNLHLLHFNSNSGLQIHHPQPPPPPKPKQSSVVQSNTNNKNNKNLSTNRVESVNHFGNRSSRMSNQSINNECDDRCMSTTTSTSHQQHQQPRLNSKLVKPNIVPLNTITTGIHKSRQVSVKTKSTSRSTNGKSHGTVVQVHNDDDNDLLDEDDDDDEWRCPPSPPNFDFNQNNNPTMMN